MLGIELRRCLSSKYFQWKFSLMNIQNLDHSDDLVFKSEDMIHIQISQKRKTALTSRHEFLFLFFVFLYFCLFAFLSFFTFCCCCFLSFRIFIYLSFCLFVFLLFCLFVFQPCYRSKSRGIQSRSLSSISKVAVTHSARVGKELPGQLKITYKIDRTVSGNPCEV